MAHHQQETIGLVAGWGRFPLLVAQALARRGYRVACVALRHHADRALEYVCDDVHWLGIAKLGGQLKYFRRQGVHRVTLAGKLFKGQLLFSGGHWIRHLPDLECLRTLAPAIVAGRTDTRDDTLLSAITNAYERYDMQVCPATDFAPELLIDAGPLGRRLPTRQQLSDMAFGWDIAKQMGGLDIGQSITVHRGTVLAVEAMEGTDACIARTKSLCRGGWTLVKVAKPKQDMRFDVPTIGLQTLKQLHLAGGRAIAIEAGKTIVVDREEITRWADAQGIAIYALRNAAEARGAA
jgi:DUF1009 family protein